MRLGQEVGVLHRDGCLVREHVVEGQFGILDFAGGEIVAEQHPDRVTLIDHRHGHNASQGTSCMKLCRGA